MNEKRLSFSPEQVAGVARSWLKKLDVTLDRIQCGATGTTTVVKATMLFAELGKCLLRLRQINARKCDADYPRYEENLKREHERNQ